MYSAIWFINGTYKCLKMKAQTTIEASYIFNFYCVNGWHTVMPYIEFSYLPGGGCPILIHQIHYPATSVR